MDFLKELGIEGENRGVSTGTVWYPSDGQEEITVVSPGDGRAIASVSAASLEDYEKVLQAAEKAFQEWRRLPPPGRGEIVGEIAIKMRDHKASLGRLIAYEMGKSLQEGLGEVQEVIDICHFAVGQSRMLYGSTLHSERPRHRMYEQYHPLGPVAIVTAFNFPMAVWAWNAMIAAVCGDVTLWKPASAVPLSAVAIQKLLGQVVKEKGLPEGLFSLLIGRGASLGDRLLADHRIPLISFTGSVATGRHAAEVVARRLGRTILELGGNNAIILTPHTNLELAIPAVVFGAVGTAGQRCTTTRRLIVHEALYDRVREALVKAYSGLQIGDPLNEQNHVGPLINKQAVDAFRQALQQVEKEGGRRLCGGDLLKGQGYESGCYVKPAIVEAENHYPIVQEETFAPILYLIKYKGSVEDAIAVQNDVRQGLSSAIFTDHLKEAERFLSAWGSDCGIANVNIGTSGAEIGGAFGGEKETGGGREAGSDAWKAYMRRQTVTINFGDELPLAQGIRFDL